MVKKEFKMARIQIWLHDLVETVDIVKAICAYCNGDL